MSRDTATATQAGAELYRGSFEFARLPLGEGQELVYLPLTRSARALSTQSIRLLQSCRTFATLDDHAVRLCRELNFASQQSAQVRQELTALVQTGFLLSHRDLLTPIRNRPLPPAPRISVLAIPTRNRTSSLQRCLESYIDNNRRHQRSVEYLVVDDSSDSGVRRANRQMLPEMKARHGVSLAYAGPEEKASFAAALVQRTGLPAEDVQFGIVNDDTFPITTGTNRNAILLHAVGETLLQVDDDTVCRLAPVPGTRGGLAFTSEYDPTEFWFVAEGQPLPAVVGDESNILEVHEQMLGKGLGNCLGELTSGLDVDLDRAGASFFRRAAPSGGRVLATAVGVMGDSGMGSPLYFLSLEGPARARFLHSEEIYRHAISRQQVVRGVKRPTISDGALCMALNLGLDQRELLPPFTPVQRNQDGVFAALLRACFSDGYFGFLPSTLLHQSPIPRWLSTEDFWRSAAQVSSGQILQALVGSFTPGANSADPRKSLLALGRALEDWGTSAAADFEELVRLVLWNQTSRKIVQLENQLRAAQGQPAYWAEDVRRLLALWRKTLPEREYAVPSDLVGTFGSDAFACLQRLVRRFGRLLQVWPDIVAATKDLRARGRRLGVEV
jgi:hypothetical protein